MNAAAAAGGEVGDRSDDVCVKPIAVEPPAAYGVSEGEGALQPDERFADVGQNFVHDLAT